MAQQSLLFGFTSKGLAALSLIAAVSYFLFVEHREDLFQFLPYLILLLCPLMHIFMHAGHGHDHGGHDGHGQYAGDSERDAHQRGLEDGRKERQHNHRDFHYIEQVDDGGSHE